jgi:hypothetical protein
VILRDPFGPSNGGHGFAPARDVAGAVAELRRLACRPRRLNPHPHTLGWCSR